MAESNPYGILSVKIPTGSCVKTGETPPKDAYIRVEFDPNLAEQPRIEGPQTDTFEFKFAQDVPLKSGIEAGASVTVHLMEHNTFSANKSMGHAKCSLTNLASGGKFGPEDVDITVGGSVKYRITVTIEWKDGNVPDSASAAGSAAASNLTKPLGGKPGEKPLPLPPCENLDYSVRVKIHRLKNLQNIAVDKNYDPRCVITAVKKTHKTEVQKNTNEPTFDEESAFNFQKVNSQFWTETLSINVVSDRFGLPDEQIGVVNVELGAIYRSNRQHALIRKWFVIVRALGDATVMGYAKLSMSVLNLRTDNLVEFGEEEDDEEKDEDITANLISVTGAAFEEIFLHCDLLKASGLPRMDSGLTGGSCDPYVKLYFGKNNVETSYIPNTLEPVWNTRVILSAMLPALAGTMRIELWDHDSPDPDDLIATYLIDIDDLMKGRKDNLPFLAPRYLNFYGHPRGADADYTRYFKEMARGNKKGIDYRGRCLLRIAGSRSKIMPSLPEVKPTLCDVDIFVEALQISQLPEDGDYKIKTMCGIASAQTKLMQAQVMKDIHGKEFTPHNSDISPFKTKYYALFFGEKIQIRVKFPVILPSRDELVSAQLDDDSGFEDADPHKMQSFVSLEDERQVVAALEKVLWEQIPGLVIHLVKESKTEQALGSVAAAIGVGGGNKPKDEDPTAAVVFQSKRFYTGGGSFCMSKAMRSMSDPDKASEGKMPANPLLQVNCGMSLVGINGNRPDIPIPLSTKPPKLVLTQSRHRSYILSVYCYHARNVPSGDDNGLSDPYVVVTWANAGARTGVKKETLNPTWNEALYVEAIAKDPLPDVVFELWDWDEIGSNTFLCKNYVSLNDLKGPKPFWIKHFTDCYGKKSPTQLLIAMTLEPATDDRRAQIRDAPLSKFRQSRDSTRTYKGYAIPKTHQLSMAQYTFNAKIFSLRQMRKYHLTDVKSPSIEFECYDNVATCPYKPKGRNADFDQEVNWILTLPDIEDYLPYLNLYVHDFRFMQKVLVAVSQVDLTDSKYRIKKKSQIKQEDEMHVKTHLAEISEYQQRQAMGSTDTSTAGTPGSPDGNITHPSLKSIAHTAAALEGSMTRFSTEGGTKHEFHGLAGVAKAATIKKSNPRAVKNATSAKKRNAEETEEEKKKKTNSPTNETDGGGGGLQASDDVEGAGTEMTEQQGGENENDGENNNDNANVAGGEGEGEQGGEQHIDEETCVDAIDVESLRLLDAKIKEAKEKLHEDLQEPSETGSTASTEPDELLWYDRFDPNSAESGTGEALEIGFEQRVARLGKVCDKAKSLGPGQSEAENVFGPFDDQYTACQLYRGWGSTGAKAGVCNIDMTFEKLSHGHKPSAPNLQSASAAAASSATSGKGSSGGSSSLASAAASASASGSSSSQSRSAVDTWKKCETRKPTKFLCRIYVIQCKELTAMDSGIFGNSSDPYCILTLTGNPEAGGTKEDVVINCKDQMRYQVLDPEFFFMRELSGELPRHSYLRVTVLDWDRMSFKDDIIGFTTINLEERYYSTRGYSRDRTLATLNCPAENDDPAAFFGLNHYGSYVEKRMLRDEQGLAAGNIELWIDLFDFSNPIPRPIDIAPPPPIPLELRVTVWNVRDCELTDENFAGEKMTDIYARCWVDQMDNQQQNTDVHYRSLDGSGSFNWRMIFPLVFDPRLKKVFPLTDASADASGKESGGASSTATRKLFGVRKEAKKVKPRLHCQLWDNDLFPGTDDFIGETNINLLSIIPAQNRRKVDNLLDDLTHDCTHCLQTFPWNLCCVMDCCKPDKLVEEMTLKERQIQAQKEMAEERAARKKKIEADVKKRIESLEEQFSPQELIRVERRLIKQAKKAAKINIFQEFLPQRRKKSQQKADDEAHAEKMQAKLQTNADDAQALATKPADIEAKKESNVAETPRQWLICRSPSGGVRIGDVQLSFSLVRWNALKEDEKLAAGKGRSEPQALPEPDRPDSSFFWLSSPFKSAIHIFWKNYKWYICTIFCIVVCALMAYLFTAEGIMQKSRNIFA